MISIFCYVVLYYNIDKIFQTLYLPYLLSNNYIENSNETISTNPELFFFLNITSYFMLFLYAYTLSYRMLILHTNDKISLGLSFLYIKYITDIILSPNITIQEYELERSVMWGFTTPLMLQMYCNTNDLTLYNINIHYYIFCITLYSFTIPFKHEVYYKLLTLLLYIPGYLFIKTLYKYKHLPFTNMYIFIWSIFMILNIIDVSGIVNPIYMHALYIITDTLSKFICNVVISNYNEQVDFVRKRMDLQSVTFVSYIIKYINQYENDNQNLSPFCKELVECYKKKLLIKIPKTNDNLRLDLLKKILPFEFDKDYINTNTNTIITTTNTNTNKKFDFICVLFMDIVNYTEIAKKYDGDIIFKLLHDVYNHFDNIIKKYQHLQKIETIGDAYMVVGDIFRNELNHKIVVKNIILLAIEFIKEIKKIQTPDNGPLSIRIGINLGSVNIGILGNEIPRLCIVGNTVNVASRLQSTADENTIQLSRHIYEIARETDFGTELNYTKKENVFLKNIGTVITYVI